MPNSPDTDRRLPRWQYRKKRKIEKRRKKRQELAEINKPAITVAAQEDPVDTLAEQQKYQKAKQHWEEREEKFKLLELSKKKAREKEERAKAIAKKRWEDTLMNLPMLPPHLLNSTTSSSSDQKTSTGPFKKFIQSDNTIALKKTYRERFLERKIASVGKR